MDDDIEILDIFDNDKKEEALEPMKKMSRVEKNSSSSHAKPKKRRVKVRAVQVLFCFISALFILGCLGFYGYRFVKYYRIYNPKATSSNGSVLLAKDIVGKSEFAIDNEDGLFSSGGNFIYKGMVSNNYLKYNNMLWRIVRINADNSIDIILDDYITLLPWGNAITDFVKSDIYDYLNKDFLINLDKEMLVNTSFCTDKIADLTKITCSDQNTESYVKLLDVANFLNSINNGKSYLVDSEEIFWLADYSDDKIWHTNGNNVSQSEANSFYEIKPMVRLKNTTVYNSGDGSIKNPFIVGKDNKLSVGSTIMLGEDKWIVYDMTSDIKLMKAELITKQSDFDQEKLTYQDSNIMKYLNDIYLKSLSYQDILVETTWYTGGYKNSISDIKNETVKAKVGIPNLLDIKFDSKLNMYFTSTSKEDRILIYENPLRPSRVTTYRSIRPCVAISKDSIDKFEYADGIFKVGE